MTDSSGAGAPLRASLTRAAASDRGWQGVLAAGAAVLLAAVGTLVVGLRDPASADTVVTSVTGAVVALPGGTEHEARIGETLPRGAQLRTGPAGGATLTTDGRDVLVGALSTVRVLDGVRQTLERGQVMVDTRRGAHLDLGTKAGTVKVDDDSLARVEQRLAGLRLGVFEGAGATLAVTGRSATARVPQYYQVVSQYGGLPGRTTALALTNDAWEQKRAFRLFQADEQLTRQEADLRGSQGALVISAAPVALRQAAPSAAAGCGSDRGEQALALAVAAVSRLDDAPAAVLARVCGSRAEGGSWGVVAAIVRASAESVSGQLALGLPDDPNASVDASGPLGPTDLLGGSPTSTAAPGSGGSPRPVTSGPTASPRPTVTSSPTVVDDVVTVVTGLLPTPNVAPPAPPAPTPSPTRTPLIDLGIIKIG